MALVSKQLRILQLLSEHLAGMTVDGGYGYDMADQVFRGRAMLGDETDLPALSILEAPRPDENPIVGGHEGLNRIEDWVLLVQGWVENDEANPTDPAYDLKAHVERRLAEIVAVNDRGNPVDPALYRLGGLIAGLSIGPGVVSPPRERVSATAFFYLPVVVKFSASVADPFVTVEETP